MCRPHMGQRTCLPMSVDLIRRRREQLGQRMTSFGSFALEVPSGRASSYVWAGTTSISPHRHCNRSPAFASDGASCTRRQNEHVIRTPIAWPPPGAVATRTKAPSLSPGAAPPRKSTESYGPGNALASGFRKTVPREPAPGGTTASSRAPRVARCGNHAPTRSLTGFGAPFCIARPGSRERTTHVLHGPLPP